MRKKTWGNSSLLLVLRKTVKKKTWDRKKVWKKGRKKIKRWQSLLLRNLDVVVIAAILVKLINNSAVLASTDLQDQPAGARPVRTQLLIVIFLWTVMILFATWPFFFCFCCVNC